MRIDAWLYSYGGSFRSFRLGTVTQLGRDSTCEVVLDDAKVSRQHARIDLTGGAFVLSDLSRNGVALNGRRIKQPTALSEGDRLQLGDTTLTFTFQPPHDATVEETVRRSDDTVHDLVTMLDRLVGLWHLRRALVLARPPGCEAQQVFIGRPAGADGLSEADRESIATASGGGTVSRLIDVGSEPSALAYREQSVAVVCLPLGEPEIVGVLYLELTRDSPRELLKTEGAVLSVLVHSLSEALKKRVR